ncbi:MAG TPA: hypothetical protein VIL21_04430 [Solirubrobacterales bacterium]
MELAGPRAKFEWAVKHLQLLDRECGAILESKPFRVAPEFDQEAGCYVLRFRIREDAFPLHLGLRVGDIVHAARSALDQAVWLIACRSNPIKFLWERDIGRNISFPIVWVEKSFPKHRVMPYIADDAKAVLDFLQPYQGGDLAKAIGDLDTLWNIDKHRVIHQSTVQLDISHIGFRPAAIGIKHMEPPFPEITWHPLEDPFKDGAKIASIRFRDGAGPPETKVQVNGEPSAVVAFGSGFFALSIDVLGGLLVHVSQALSMIESLPEAAPPSRASTEKG